MPGFDLDAWLDSGVVRSDSVKVCLRADLIAHHTELDIELNRARTSAEKQRIAKRVTKLEAEIEAAQQEFKFEGLAAREYADLRRAHLPTNLQLAGDQQLDHNPETFPPALVAASCVEPELSFEDAEKIMKSKKVDFSEWQKLFGCALGVNLEVAMPPKSLLATAILSRNGGSSTTAARGGSPDPSS
jgi:hypothetical protein